MLMKIPKALHVGSKESAEQQQQKNQKNKKTIAHSLEYLNVCHFLTAIAKVVEGHE